MSLLRQLLVSVSVAIFVILIGAVWLSTQSAREYLNTQLQIQADSAVTSLALTLSQPSNQDEITRELIIAAIFDTGQFNRIEFSEPDGQLTVQKQSRQADTKGVPQWFANYASINTARAVAQVSDGWRQVGQVMLEADPAYARNTLWHSFLRLVGWVVAAGLVWGIFVLFLIRWLRRVLHVEVAERLKALAQEDSGAVTTAAKSHPTFIELQEVTQALDSARQSILATAEERQMKIQSLVLELNQDPITKLANRKYFINELRLMLEKGQKGWLLIARLRDLAEINRSLSRPLVDDWLLSMSQQLQAYLTELLGEDSFVLARLNGSDFVLLLGDLPVETLNRITQALREELLRQRIQLSSGDFCRWAFAQTNLLGSESFSHVLARLDQALMRAESAGHEQIERLAADDAGLSGAFLTKGETQWGERLKHALQDGHFTLAIHANEHRQGWSEATLMLADDPENPLSAFQFMPVAARLGLSGACDLQAIRLGLKWLADHEGRLAVRVSLPSLSQGALLDEIPRLLAEDGVQEQARRLYIELDAFALESSLTVVQAFAEKVQPYGVGLGVRRILQLPQVVLEFDALKINYAKLDGDMLRGVSSKPSGLTFVKALWAICRQAGTAWVLEPDIKKGQQSLLTLLQENGIYFE